MKEAPHEVGNRLLLLLSSLNRPVKVGDNATTTPVARDIEAVRDRLVGNAIAYLEKGMGEFPAELNFALLHFYGGVELAIKACLLHEDWRLVVQEPGDADWIRFCSGKQKTVGLEDAAKRLKNLRDKPIGREALKAFEKLRIHRNQLTHFFHPGLNMEQVSRRVSGELLVAWYHLHKLLQTAFWAPVFQSFSSRISAIDVRLQAVQDFLQTVFSTQVAVLPNAAEFERCPACGFQGLNPQTDHPDFESQCLVCGFADLSHRAVKRGAEPIHGHCLWCDERGCVYPTEYGARCAACGESFTHIKKCEYCGESFAGCEDEDAGDYQTGCEFCGGNLGYLMSKDD
jgi:hypothetical protein